MKDEDAILSPLRLVATEELVDELKARVDGGIVVLLRSHERDEIFFADYFGGLSLCIGLAERMRARLLETALSSDAAAAEDLEAEF